MLYFQGGDPRRVYGPSTRGGIQAAGRGISKPRMQRGFRDATGQLIVDHDDGMDNLSDKEIYARNIPAIGNQILLQNSCKYRYRF